MQIYCNLTIQAERFAFAPSFWIGKLIKRLTAIKNALQCRAKLSMSWDMWLLIRAHVCT